MGHVRINSSKLYRVVHKMSQDASERAAHKLRERIRAEIIQSGRILTGEMMERIDVERAIPHPFEGRAHVQPKTKQYHFQDDGTRGTPYRPGRILRFRPKGSGVFIFRRSTGPITAARFTDKAARKMRPHDWT